MNDDQRIALKFSPPTPPPGFIQRPRLANQVAKGLSGRLILLNAPMGFGKTSLLSSMAQQWSSYSNASTVTFIAWFSLGPSDNDAAAFMDGLVGAVRWLFPDFGKSVRALVRGSADASKQMNNLFALFKDEINKAVDGEIAIVLDDFHFITNKSIVDALELAIRDPESRIKWIISTQSDPELYLSPLISRDGVVEIGDEALRFTFDEVRELLSARTGETAGNEIVGEIIRDTDGWPSATNLVGLIAARDPDALRFERLFPTQHGYARIVRWVVSGLPPSYRETVLRSSLLSYLDPSSCREALGLDDAEDFLLAIQDAMLPVTKPSNREGPLVFEPLFRSALERELSKKLSALEYRKLKCKVASYYSAKGDRDEAIRGFLSVGANEEAAVEMEKSLDAEREQGRLDLILGWLKALPVSIRQQHPRLLIHEARLFLARERQDDARALLAAARAELEASGDTIGMGRLLGSWAALYLLEGRNKDARKTAEDALKSLPESEYTDVAEARWLLSRSLELSGLLKSAYDEASRGLLAAEQSGRQPIVVRAMLQLGHLAYLRGNYEEALALAGRAVQRSALSDMEMLTLGSAGGLASIAYLERGQTQEAAVVAARSLEVSRQYGDTAASMRAGLALAVASEHLGQRAHAREKLLEALRLSSKLAQHVPESFIALQAAAEILHRQGKRKEALARAKQALANAINISNSVMVDRCRLMVAAYDMAGLRLPVSLLRIFRLSRDFERMDSKHWFSGAQQLLAMGFWRLGLKHFARSSLRRSMEIAAKESYSGTPLGLPDAKVLLPLAIKERILHEKAGNLLGVELAEAKKIISPLTASKKPALMARAREAIAGIETGAGRPQNVRLMWPGLADSDNYDNADLLICVFGQFEAFLDGEYVEWPSSDARDLAADSVQKSVDEIGEI